MRINHNVHQIQIFFHLTPQIERFVYIYLIEGKNCYLVDTGVDGSEKIIEEYMNSIGRNIKEVKGILLTHSHPDHIGAANEIKRLSGCKVYASLGEKSWIENIDKQFNERPIPNFYGLLNKSVQVDNIVKDSMELKLEDDITVSVINTMGHSEESISYQLIEEKILFTGDAVPVIGDIPIYISAAKSMDTLRNLSYFEGIEFYCSAWDKLYNESNGMENIKKAYDYLRMIDQSVNDIVKNYPAYSDEEKYVEICNKQI